MKKLLLLAFVILLLCPVLGHAWLEGTVVGVPERSTTQEVPILIAHNQGGIPSPPQGQWITIGVPQIPADAIEARLKGHLIITGGNLDATCSMSVYFRNYGDYGEYEISEYIVEANHGGVRAPVEFGVPVNGRLFQFKWESSTMGPWPDHCAYCLNLRPVGYVR